MLTKKFQALKAHWYKKLKDSGFKDLESQEMPDGILNEGFLADRFRERRNTNPQNEQYYRLAGHFLHDYLFRSSLDKLIWEYHSEGASVREIVQKLKHKGIRYSRSSTDRIIQRLAKVMIKFYEDDDYYE